MILSAIDIVPLTANRRRELVDLLAAEKLPVQDLPEQPENFFVAVSGKKIVGGIGLEQHGSYGLLRSLVVDPAWRSRKVAGALVHQVEQRARALGMKDLFLLTETAPHYFQKKGFDFISRAEVPERLKQSSEFSNVCPQSAAVMKMNLDQNDRP